MGSKSLEQKLKIWSKHMYILKVSDSFSAAHKLCGYEGACRNLHGHNWKVGLEVQCNSLDEIGLAMDFGILKRILGMSWQNLITAC